MEDDQNVSQSTHENGGHMADGRLPGDSDNEDFMAVNTTAIAAEILETLKIK